MKFRNTDVKIAVINIRSNDKLKNVFTMHHHLTKLNAKLLRNLTCYLRIPSGCYYNGKIFALDEQGHLHFYRQRSRRWMNLDRLSVFRSGSLSKFRNCLLFYFTCVCVRVSPYVLWTGRMLLFCVIFVCMVGSENLVMVSGSLLFACVILEYFICFCMYCFCSVPLSQYDVVWQGFNSYSDLATNNPF